MREFEMLKEKYLIPHYPIKVGELREDIEYFGALRELNLITEEESGDLQERLNYLSGLIQEAEDEDELTDPDGEDAQEDEEDEETSEDPSGSPSSSAGGVQSRDNQDEDSLSFDTEPEETPENLGDEEETFSNKYPNVDGEEVLKQTYNDWLENINKKPFYKAIEGYYNQKLSGSLNYLERGFLWKFMKAISSAITHLLIEGEQKEEAIYLVQKYYDSLAACLDKVIHAADKEDVIQAFDFMVEFLGILSDDDEVTDSEKDEF